MAHDMASFISLSIQKFTEKPEIDAKHCVCMCEWTQYNSVGMNENRFRRRWINTKNIVP